MYELIYYVVRVPQLTEAETKRSPFSGRHFQMHFLEWKCMIKISLKFIPKGPVNNIPALVQIMAWRRTGDKPLSEPMVTKFADTYIRHSASMSLYVIYFGDTFLSILERVLNTFDDLYPKFSKELSSFKSSINNKTINMTHLPPFQW